MRRRYRRNSCRRIGAVRRKIGIYIHIIFSTLFSHVMSPATLLSYLQNNIRVWIFLPAIIISHMGFGVYMLILFLIVILLLICKGIMDDEMLCIIASEDPGIAFSC